MASKEQAAKVPPQSESQAIEQAAPEKVAVAKPSLPARDNKTLKTFLESEGVKKALSEAVGKSGLSASDLVRLTLVAATKQPLIYKCTLESIMRALLDAAALGITVGGLNGRGYIVPRNVKVKYFDVTGVEQERNEQQAFLDPGYRGFMDIARDSGQISTICAEVVREHDHFELWYDPEPKMKFRPLITAKVAEGKVIPADRGQVVGAFAMAKLKDGSIQLEFMTRGDLDKVKDSSESGKRGKGPWQDWYEEMARKSVLRRLCKFLPVRGRAAERMDLAMNLSDRADTGDPSIGQPVIDVASEPVDVADQVKGELTAKAEEVDLFAMSSELDAVIR